MVRAMSIAAEDRPAARSWDIFCTVVDNYGDIGVCWRLACGLAARGQSVRLFVDDARLLSWMAPQGCPGVAVESLRAPALQDPAAGPPYRPAAVLVAAFGCPMPPAVLEALRAPRGAAAPPVWIHLEYLSAEDYVARSHGLASPVAGLEQSGVARWFYFPGFTADTGGLLREPDLMARRQAFDRRAWLAARGIDWQGEPLVSLFCYEPALLGELLGQCRQRGARLLATYGRASAAVRKLQAGCAGLAVEHLPALTQDDYDHLLWSADLNFVRGEDSFVRAHWAGLPMVWQAYPQDDGVHARKVQAWLDWLGAPPGLRHAHAAWNGGAEALPALFATAQVEDWKQVVQAARARLLSQEDLVGSLLRFVAQKTLK